MKSRLRLYLVSVSLFFLLCFGVSCWHSSRVISDELMHAQWNQYFLVASALVAGAAVVLFWATSRNVALAVAVFSLGLSIFAARPFSEVDRLFYQHLTDIQGDRISVALTEKIELCDYVKASYVNLKKQMLISLEETCASKIMQLSQRSNRELNQAFDWAYAEYARKPQSVQAAALACLYAETNQAEFALELSEKHQFKDLTAHLKTAGRCREFKNKRQVASVEK